MPLAIDWRDCKMLFLVTGLTLLGVALFCGVVDHAQVHWRGGSADADAAPMQAAPGGTPGDEVGGMASPRIQPAVEVLGDSGERSWDEMDGQAEQMSVDEMFDEIEVSLDGVEESLDDMSEE